MNAPDFFGVFCSHFVFKAPDEDSRLLVSKTLSCLPFIADCFFSPFIPYFHKLPLERCQNIQIIANKPKTTWAVFLCGCESADFWGFSADFRFQRISTTVKEIRLDLCFPKVLTLNEGSISSLWACNYGLIHLISLDALVYVNYTNTCQQQFCRFVLFNFFFFLVDF